MRHCGDRREAMEDPSGTRLYVGVDIAAETFTAAWLTPGGAASPPLTCDQTPQGYAALDQRLKAAAPPAETLVALEATGNYWVALAVALHEAGYRVAVLNPRQAHHFAKAQLRRARTDPLDARDPARPPPPPRPAPRAPPPAGSPPIPPRPAPRGRPAAVAAQG